MKLVVQKTKSKLFFTGQYGGWTKNIQNAKVFNSESDFTDIHYLFQGEELVKVKITKA